MSYEQHFGTFFFSLAEDCSYAMANFVNLKS